MDLEAHVRDAMVEELKRQAEASEGGLSIGAETEGRLQVQGPVDLEALAMAVVGSVAGGP